MRTLVTQTMIVQSGGVNLHLETAGPENGPLVILLHGFPEYWGAWINQMESLSRSGFLAAAPDQRGYNLSSKPSDVSAYHLDVLAKDVVSIIDHFQREKAVIVGHDWGALVSWYLAIHHPERVERLVIMNVPHPAVMRSLVKEPVPIQLFKSWYVLFFQIPRLPEMLLSLFNYRALRKSMRGTSRPGVFSGEEMQRYLEAWSMRDSTSGTGALTGGINWYRALMRRGVKMGPDGSKKDYALKVRVPTLVLWGDRDAFLEPVLADRSMEWVEDGQLVHFPEATHWIHHEEAPRVNNRILDFLEDVRAQRES